MAFDDYDITIEVTVDEVRTALTEIDASTIPNATISQKIEEEKLIVEAELPDDLDELATSSPKAAIEMLVRRRAARHSWHSSPTEVRQQALDAARSFDTQAFRGHLNDAVEEAYAVLGLDRDGSSAAIVDATTSMFDPDHPGRR